MRSELKPVDFGPGESVTGSRTSTSARDRTSLDTSTLFDSNTHETEEIELQERNKLLEEGNRGGSFQ